MSLDRFRSTLAILSVSLAAPAASAQCTPGWSAIFGQGAGAGADGSVECLLEHDDGTGPALYAGGSFTQFTTGLSALHIARWDGAQWSALGSGLDGEVRALASFDEGFGPRLFAAGTFEHAGGVPVKHLARWDGTSWTVVGGDLSGSQFLSVEALTVHDDGSGPKLYVGGSFTNAPGTSAHYVASWDGAQWAPLLESPPGIQNGTPSPVSALCVFDHGTGPKLYAGGGFGVQSWDGADWHSVQNSSSIAALTTFDDGSGPSLVMAGAFTNNPSMRILGWTGSVFHAFGNSGIGSFGAPSEYVRAVASFDDGSGPGLYATGNFASASGVPLRNLACWRNGVWSAVGSGLDGAGRSLCPSTLGGSPRLFTGGYFRVADTAVAVRVAQFDGSSFTTLGPANPTASVNGTVDATAVYDDGTGPALYALGSFDGAGDAVAGPIARWDGASWSAVGATGVVRPTQLNWAALAHDDGSGSALYVGGMFTTGTGVGRWNGSSWSLLPGAFNGVPYCFEVFDDGSGPALYVGGAMTSIGGTTVDRVARWDGIQWSALGAGFDGIVYDLEVFDDGSGPALVASGGFTHSGPATTGNIARWDGNSWSGLGSGAPPSRKLLAADLGAGSRLYASTSTGVMQLVGPTWVTLGSTNSFAQVGALAVLDDGAGPALYSGGFASTWGLRRFDGVDWVLLDSAPTGQGGVTNFSVFDGLLPGRPDLYVGGSFTKLGGADAAYLTIWRGCLAPVQSFCAGDGSLVPCPCANSGASGRGCENSFATGGSRLDAHGTTNPDTMVLNATGELPSALSIFLQGTLEIAPAAFGDGLRCVGGALRRLYTKSAVGGAVSAPVLGDPSIQVRSAALGDTIAPGSPRVYQVYYRDASPSFCPAPAGKTWNVSNGVRVTW